MLCAHTLCSALPACCLTLFLQDTEFTVQDGKLFMLQTRNGKRTGPAALKIAIDLEAEVSRLVVFLSSCAIHPLCCCLAFFFILLFHLALLAATLAVDSSRASH